MTISEADEFLHEPEADDHWQENLFFILWDDARRNGFMTHVKRVPVLGWQEALTVVCVRDKVVSTTIRQPLDNKVLGCGLEMTPDKPFEQWTIKADFAGAPGYGPFGFIATHRGVQSRARCDVQIHSVLAPVDFHSLYIEATKAMRANPDAPQMGGEPGRQHHYEQGGTFEGWLEVDGERVQSQGLYVRDHSWGIRHERAREGGFRAFWTASTLDEGAIYCNAIGWPMGDGTCLGVGVYADRDGVRTTTEVNGSFVPQTGPWAYDTATITYGAGVGVALEAESRIHWPMYLPYSGFRRYDQNALSNVRIGDHTGFGVIEWATVMSAAQAEVIDAGLPVARPEPYDHRDC